MAALCVQQSPMGACQPQAWPQGPQVMRELHRGTHLGLPICSSTLAFQTGHQPLELGSSSKPHMVSDDIRWNCTFRFFGFRKPPPSITWTKTSFRIPGPMLRGSSQPNPSQLLLSSSSQSIPCRLLPHTHYLQSFSFLTSKLLIRISRMLSLHAYQSLFAKPLKLGSYSNVFHHSCPLGSTGHPEPWSTFESFLPWILGEDELLVTLLFLLFPSHPPLPQEKPWWPALLLTEPHRPLQPSGGCHRAALVPPAFLLMLSLLSFPLWLIDVLVFPFHIRISHSSMFTLRYHAKRAKFLPIHPDCP